MVKIAICDDDKTMLDFVSKNVDNLFAQNEIKHTIVHFLSGKKFLEAHKSDPFDVIFLDIVMPDINGFDIAEKIRSVSENTYIIFVTTEDTLVYDSFSFQPFDFIPKYHNQTTDYFEAKLNSVIQRLADKLNKFKEISLIQPYGETLNVVCSDIILIKSSGNYVEYNIRNRENVRVRAKLDDVEKELEQSIFLRLHKSYIVNMDFISTINYAHLLVTLKDGTIVTISKAYKKAVKVRYMEYIRNLGR